MPVDRRRPGTRTLGPFDQNERSLAYHVVETEVARFIGVAQAIAVDVVDRRYPCVVVMDEGVGGTRRAGARRS